MSATPQWSRRLAVFVCALVLFAVGTLGSLGTARFASDPAGATAAPPTVGTNKVLVLLAYWDAPGQSPSSVNDTVFGEYNRYLQEVSYSQFSISGTVTPWMKIPQPTCAEWQTGGVNALAAAETAAKSKYGYDQANYDRVVLYEPTSYCIHAAPDTTWAPGGWTLDVPTREIWLNGELGDFLHELGHAMGLQHASRYECSDASGPITLGTKSQCTQPGSTDWQQHLLEYGDGYSPMGWGWETHYSAREKEQLGWLNGREAILSPFAPSATLAPFESSSTGKHAARLDIAGRSYYVEYRQALGSDAKLFAQAFNGVVVHMVDQSVSAHALLLDGDPKSTPWPWQRDGFDFRPFPFGSSWTTPEGVTLSFGGASPTGVTVRATFPRVQGTNVAPNADGRLETFFLDTAGSIRTQWQTSPSFAWSGWATLARPAGVTFVSQPSVAIEADGTLSVFARGSDNAIYQWRQSGPNGSWLGATYLGGSVLGRPVAAPNADGRLQLFVRGFDKTVYVRSENTPNGTWAGWYQLNGTAFTSDVSVGIEADHRVSIFGRGPDGSVTTAWETAPNGGWSASASLGGLSVGQPAVAPNRDGRLQVFARGTDNVAYTKSQVAPNRSWGAWTSIDGAVLDSDVAPVVEPDGYLAILAHAVNGAIYETDQHSSSAKGPMSVWGPLEDSYRPFAGQPVAGINAQGQLEQFTKGTDGYLSTSSNGLNGWGIYVNTGLAVAN